MARQDDLRDIDDALKRVGRIGRGRAATRLRAEVSGVDLTNAAVGILGALHKHGALRASALAEAADTEAPLVSRELRNLTAEGYVTTTPDPTDGRGRIVALTRKGRSTYERFRDGADRITAHAFREWSDDDIIQFRAMMLRVVDDFSTTDRPELTRPPEATCHPPAGVPSDRRRGATRRGTMAEHELVIRNGTVVDGTGAPRRRADVAVDGGKVTEVGAVDGTGRRELDADGLVVAPGWVDIHTHYDGQASWDPFLSPSPWHGVTTVVMGNCGVGLRPRAPRPPRVARRPDGGRGGHPRHRAARGHHLGVGDLPRVPRRARRHPEGHRPRRPGAPRRGAGLRHGRPRRRPRRASRPPTRSTAWAAWWPRASRPAPSASPPRAPWPTSRSTAA